jgi:hypothetical protein
MALAAAGIPAALDETAGERLMPPDEGVASGISVFDAAVTREAEAGGSVARPRTIGGRLVAGLSGAASCALSDAPGNDGDRNTFCGDRWNGSLGGDENRGAVVVAEIAPCSPGSGWAGTSRKRGVRPSRNGFPSSAPTSGRGVVLGAAGSKFAKEAFWSVGAF